MLDFETKDKIYNLIDNMQDVLDNGELNKVGYDAVQRCVDLLWGIWSNN